MVHLCFGTLCNLNMLLILVLTDSSIREKAEGRKICKESEGQDKAKDA